MFGADKRKPVDYQVREGGKGGKERGKKKNTRKRKSSVYLYSPSSFPPSLPPSFLSGRTHGQRHCQRGSSRCPYACERPLERRRRKQQWKEGGREEWWGRRRRWRGGRKGGRSGYIDGGGFQGEGGGEQGSLVGGFYCPVVWVLVRRGGREGGREAGREGGYSFSSRFIFPFTAKSLSPSGRKQQAASKVRPPSLPPSPHIHPPSFLHPSHPPFLPPSLRFKSSWAWSTQLYTRPSRSPSFPSTSSPSPTPPSPLPSSLPPSGQVKLGMVDATVHTNLAGQFDVKGYPSIKVGREGGREGGF